jgi:head-tail adaptor
MAGVGTYRERLMFQRRAVVADDGTGNTEGGWVDVFCEPCNIVAARGGEQALAARLQNVRPVEVEIHQSSRTRQIATDWRAVNARNRSELYNIHDIRDPDGRKRKHILTCSLGAPT